MVPYSDEVQYDCFSNYGFSRMGLVLMKIGDLIYDSHYGQNGLVVEISETSSYMTVLYEDGQVDHGMRTNDPEVEVISESR